MQKPNFLLLMTFLIISVLGCKKDDPVDSAVIPSPSEISAEMANEYFILAIKITKETAGFTPPVAARAYGYSGLALYESVVGGMPQYQSLKGKISSFPLTAYPTPPTAKIHWGVVANRAMSVCMFNLYKAASLDNLTAIVDIENKYEQAFKTTISDGVYETSRTYGETIGNAIADYAKTDGQEFANTTNFPLSYTPPVFSGAWVPTPPAMQRPLQPYWGNVRPFVQANTSTQPPPPISFSTASGSAFYLQAEEVYTVSQTLTDEQKKIASFWSDDPGNTGTPPGHSISIAKIVLEKENAKLDKAAETYAKVGMAVHDAFISCWKCKYDYSLMRPITYIRNEFDSNYLTFLTTPPFPEYTSGHSVQSGASAYVLTKIFGDNYAFTDNTHANRTDIDGSPRSFTSFMDAADEAAFSRLYGGIHYRMGIEEGVTQGIAVGTNIDNLPFKK